MKIIQIDAARFGGLTIDSPVKLEDGLNLWISTNQAGKTTLLTFLEWMLYGPTSKRSARDSEVVNRWTPWRGGQPTGRLVIKPELNGWPEEILVAARFSDYFVQLMEYRTQKPIEGQVEVSRSGEWDLGDRLLNLNRASFRNSLAALQGNLLDPLKAGKLKEILSSDIGSLVENPEALTVDRITSTLANPVFRIANSSPMTLRELRVNITKEADLLELEHKGLEQQLDKFRDLITHHDAVAAQYEQQQRVTSNLNRQAQQLDLARSFFLHSQDDKKPQEAVVEDKADWQKEHPEYLNITPELESEVDKLSGKLEAIEQQLAREQSRLENLERDYATEQSRLSASESGAHQTSAAQLRKVAMEVERASDEFERTKQRLDDLTGQIPDEQRHRYQELEKLYAPHYEHLAAIIDWQRDHHAINQKASDLRELREALRIQTRIKLPPTFYVGIALIFVALIMPVLFGSLLPLASWLGWIIMMLILIISIIFISPYWKMRKMVGPPAQRLKSEVEPGLAECTANLAAQDRKRRRFIELYEIDRLNWDKLVDNILEFSDLDMKFREFSIAKREYDTNKSRMEAAWVEVGQILPLAPITVDLNWLRQETKVLSVDEAGSENRLKEIATRLDEQRSDVKRLATEQAQLSKLIEEKLTPVGMAGHFAKGIAQGLTAFRQIADQVRRVKRPADVAAAEMPISKSGMSRGEFVEKWEALSDAERTRLQVLVRSRQDFDSVSLRLQELAGARREANRVLDELGQKRDELRDQLVKFKEIDRQAAQLKKSITSSERRQLAIERWDKALKLSTRIIGSLVDRTRDDIAPEVTKELARVLAEAPIKGIRKVELGPNLELNVEVEGAPHNIPPHEIWTYLSAGAQQQLALAIRLAMAHTASGRTDLPLFLDEPLAELDDERSELVFKYIAKLAGTSQVIFTTCHARLYQWLMEQVGQTKTLQMPTRS